MMLKAWELAGKLLINGFSIRSFQEEDVAKALDAEVEIKPNVVIQIGCGSTLEFGVTVEPYRTKRAASAFRHVGYYEGVEQLMEVLKTVCETTEKTTWNELVAATAELRGEFHIKELYQTLADHPKSKINKNYRAKIRQAVQTQPGLFRWIERGRYAFEKPGTAQPAQQLATA